MNAARTLMLIAVCTSRLVLPVEAGEMTAQNSSASPDSSEWDQIDPVLDEAMSLLSGADRTILLLRY